MQIPNTPQGARPQNGGGFEPLIVRLSFNRGNELGLASMHIRIGRNQTWAENVIRRAYIAAGIIQSRSVVYYALRAECNRSDPAPINYSPPAKSAAANDTARRINLGHLIKC